MHDPVNSPPVDAGTEQSLVVYELLPDPLGMFHDLPVEVDDVQCSVRPSGRIDRHEPGIGGGQKISILLDSPGRERRAIRDQAIGMHQVVDRFGNKIGPLIVVREGAARVDRLAAGRSKVIQFGQTRSVPGLCSVGSNADGIDTRSLPVIGRRMPVRVDDQMGIAGQIRILNDDVLNVSGVPGGETVSGGIKRQAELGVSGHRLQLSLIGSDPKIQALFEDIDRGDIRQIGKTKGLSQIAELLESLSDSDLRVGDINPVVDLVGGRVEPVLGIDLREPGENDLADIGTTVPVGVFQVEEIGGTGDQEAALQGRALWGKWSRSAKMLAFS